VATQFDISQDIQQALELYKSAGVPEIAGVAPDLQKDWTVAAGFQQYNLEAPAKMMFPQLTPIRNLTPRDSGSGKQAEYKAVTGINTTNLNGWVAEKSAASTIQTSTSDIVSAYKSMALADSVSFESTWQGRTFMDIKALAVMNLLRAMMIQEENNLLFGQNSVAAANQQAPGAVGTPAAPGLAAAGTGSNFAAVAYYVFQTAITGMGESLPSASATITPTAGQNLTVTPTPVAGQPVFGYNIYVSTTNTSASSKKATASNMAAAVSGGSVAGISWLTNGQAVTLTSIPTGAAPPVTDGTASSLAYNGLIPQIYGGSGAQITALNGTLTTAAIDTLFLNLWNNSKADPDAVYCNAQESVKLTNLTFGAGAPYFVVPDGGQNQGTAGFRAARLINKVVGTEVPVRVHPTIPQGFMLFLSTKLPSWYVPSEIPNVFDLSLVQDYIEIDYPPTSTAAYWQVEVRLNAALRLYMPLLQGVLSGINIS
jgi:hypothetical protein